MYIHKQQHGPLLENCQHVRYLEVMTNVFCKRAHLLGSPWKYISTRAIRLPGRYRLCKVLTGLINIKILVQAYVRIHFFFHFQVVLRIKSLRGIIRTHCSCGPWLLHHAPTVCLPACSSRLAGIRSYSHTPWGWLAARDYKGTDQQLTCGSVSQALQPKSSNSER